MRGGHGPYGGKRTVIVKLQLYDAIYRLRFY